MIIFVSDSMPWIAPTLIIICISLTPLWGYIAAKNPFTKEVLNDGWTPVVAAMIISSFGGLILDYTISNYKGIAVFQLVINGVGGNLVAVQASRISTDLHMGIQTPKICISPFHVFFASGKILNYSNIYFKFFNFLFILNFSLFIYFFLIIRL